MKLHSVRVHSERDKLPKEHQLAYKIASVASDDVAVGEAVTDMVINRIIDSVAVATVALNRAPVAAARAQAIAHGREGGGTVLGLPQGRRVHAEWAAWANAVAVAELDFQDTFLSAEFAHPADSIAPVLAVAQQQGRDGKALLRGIATAYEINIALAKSISLNRHKIDHGGHLAPAVSAGIGAALGLGADEIYEAVNQSAHLSIATRQARKGQISTWKAFAPAYSGKLAIEAVDRAMRGQTSPAPIWEGEDSIIAWLLDGPDAHYEVPLPEMGEAKRAILETFPKEHAAEYQAQALIDLAIAMSKDVHDWDKIKEIIIRTSHHTHYVIGTGSKDPQKYDPGAARETLDHSLMYIFAVALQDRHWHSTDSYLPERARRSDTVKLWRKIRTVEDAMWTKRYFADDPSLKAFGGKVHISYEDGGVQEAEIAVANAHPLGAHPFGRADYIRKFTALTEDLVDSAERSRFLDLVQHLPELSAEQLTGLTLAVKDGTLADARPGIF